MTFNCGLDLDLVWLNYGFCTSSHRGEHLITKLNENPFRLKGDMKRTRNSNFNHMAFNWELDLESAWMSHGFYTLSN